MKNWLAQKMRLFLKKIAPLLGKEIQKSHLDFSSPILQRSAPLSIFAFRYQFLSPPMALLLINDGQDAAALDLENTLDQLCLAGEMPPLLVVGIHAGDRMQEYGTAAQADYAQRGSRAGNYSRFIIEELLPYLRQHYPLSQDPALHAFAGFSLGGLSAFDIVWQHSHIFQRVGVFSGSLWWRSTPFDPQNPDADRIVHDTVLAGAQAPELRFWLQTGTHDETADRNNNGIIDAIDDTLDLIEALKQVGYPDEAIQYVEVEGGEHNPRTWGMVMPDFLRWLFA